MRGAAVRGARRRDAACGVAAASHLDETLAIRRCGDRRPSDFELPLTLKLALLFGIDGGEERRVLLAPELLDLAKRVRAAAGGGRLGGAKRRMSSARPRRARRRTDRRRGRPRGGDLGGGVGVHT